MSNNISKNFNVLAILLIIASLIMLSETLGFFPGLYKIWPTLLTLVGGGFIIIFMNKGKVEIPMMGIGLALILTSLLFFYLNYTSWYNLTILWPLFISFTGISFGVCSLYTKLKIFKYLSLGLISLSIAFILIFSISYKFWPISITLLGVSFLLISIQENKYAKNK